MFARTMRQRAGGIGRATMIERQTTKLPTDVFLWVAGAFVLGSLVLKTAKREEDSLFVGQWVPTLLILGLVSKLAKRFGED